MEARSGWHSLPSDAEHPQDANANILQLGLPVQGLAGSEMVAGPFPLLKGLVEVSDLLSIIHLIELLSVRPLGSLHKETGIYKSICCLSDFFRNPVYLGIVKCGDIQVEGAHEPLVDKDTWDRVQFCLNARPHKGKRWPRGLHPKQRVSSYLLSGLIRCGQCGSAMIGSYDRLKSGKRWRFYVCGKRKREGIAGCHTGKLKASLIEGAVMRQVRDRILTTSYARTLLQAVNRQVNEEATRLDGEMARVRRRLAEVNRAIYNLLDLAERGSSAAARERLEEREVEKAQLEGNCGRSWHGAPRAGWRSPRRY